MAARLDRILKRTLSLGVREKLPYLLRPLADAPRSLANVADRPRYVRRRLLAQEVSRITVDPQMARLEGSGT